MKIIFHWLLSALVLGLSALLLPGVEVSLTGALLGAAVIGVFNLLIKPLLTLLTLPINILTLGLFGIVLNAGALFLIAMIVPGFAISSFWWALLLSIVLSLFNIFFGIKR